MTTTTITTEDGAKVGEGDIVYDYYSMEVVQIGESHGCGFAGWFDTLRPNSIDDEHPRGIRSRAGMLNGARICTLRMARRQGFPGIEHWTDDGRPVPNPADPTEITRIGCEACAEQGGCSCESADL